MDACQWIYKFNECQIHLCIYFDGAPQKELIIASFVSDGFDQRPGKCLACDDPHDRTAVMYHAALNEG